MTPRRIGGPGPLRLSTGTLPLADLAAGLGLLVIAALSLALLTGNLPLARGGKDGGGGNGPIQTPTPSNVVIVDPRANVPGRILYVKAGNIWLQHGATATARTSGGQDSMASFSADGEWIYFIRTVAETGLWRVNGVGRRFSLETPTLMRIRADGATPAEALLEGRISTGTYIWSTFLRQPVASPDGTTIVVVTDGPDPTKGDVVLKSFDPATGKLTALKVPENAPLGHQDPAWSPDGRSLLFVKNGRDGSRGAPVIMRYDVGTAQATAVTGPGYTSPAWSPDGRFIAATRTTTFGTDIVILDAARGTELLRVTNDERSFDPVWSPAGDTIAYPSLSGGVTDLWSVGVTTSGVPALKGSPLQLTISAGLDAASRPGWWIPASQLPTPAPTAVPTAGAPGAGGSTGGSSGPSAAP
ncbi:MAG: PD40 domain-containing protein [Chloroflexi bacterium]|nr:PD40 domain-containing protein [Chloroflexota bacterium]